MAKPGFLIDVVPLTVLPFQKSTFTYHSSKKIPSGSVVTVPLSGRTVLGVVFGSQKIIQKPAWLKEVTKVEDRPPLTEKQMALAEFVSNDTFTPLGKVLKHFVPQKARTRSKKIVPHTQIKYTPTKIVASFIQEGIAKATQERNIFLTLPASQISLGIVQTLLSALQKKSAGQILILVPDISTAVRLENAWQHYWKQGEIVSLYHTKSAGEYYQAWSAIQGAKVKIIIATRHGMFAPFQKLKTIIQLDPSDDSYKQWDMSPRYHTDAVLPALQELWKTKYIGIGALPTLPVKAKEVPVLTWPHAVITPTWVNLKIERFQKNWGVFSKPLEAAINKTLSNQQQVILYIHQGGLESFSVCAECRAIFRCPSCKTALKLTASDHYQCFHCHFRSNLFPKCPECGNIHFKSVGTGTEKVWREANKLFLNAKIIIADKKHLPDHKKVRQFLEKAEEQEPDILIATASYLRFPPLSRVGLVAIIDADTLLALPGYRKDEQFLELIEKSKSLLLPDGQLLVQTFHPESDLFDKVEKRAISDLLAQFLEERGVLRYPPVYRSLTLESRPKLKNGKKFLENATKELKSLIAKEKTLKKTIVVQSLERKVRGRMEKYTLVRYLPPLALPLENFLAKKADTIFIDHDPLQIT